MYLSHHAGAPAAGVWDTPWPWALCALVFFAVLAGVAEWMLRPPQYVGRHGAPDWWFETLAEPEYPPLPVVVFLPVPPKVEPVLVDGPPGRHYVGWPARNARLLAEDTGEYGLIDDLDALWEREDDPCMALTAGGVR